MKIGLEIVIVGPVAREDRPVCNAQAGATSGKSGPGTKPRFVSEQQFAANWDAAFGPSGKPN